MHALLPVLQTGGHVDFQTMMHGLDAECRPSCGLVMLMRDRRIRDVTLLSDRRLFPESLVLITKIQGILTVP